MAQPATPDGAVILDVMTACSCTELEARNLLKHSNGNAEKAKLRHKTLMRFMPTRSSSQPPSIQSVSLRPELSVESTAINLSDVSSDFEILTLPQDVEPLQRERSLRPDNNQSRSSVDGNHTHSPLEVGGKSVSYLTRQPIVRSEPTGNEENLDQPTRVPPIVPPRPWKPASDVLPVQQLHPSSTPPIMISHHTRNPTSDNSPLEQQTKPVSQISPGGNEENQSHSLPQQPSSQSQTLNPHLSGFEAPNQVTSHSSPMFVNKHKEKHEDVASFPRQTSKSTTSLATPQNHTEQHEWDFTLPHLSIPKDLIPVSDQGGAKIFNLRDVTAALQGGADEHVVSTYFDHFDIYTIRRHINDFVAGFPSIFFAAATNNDRIVRLWITCGGNVNTIEPRSRTPLLAFTIIHSGMVNRDASHTVATLLSLGASPLVIPPPFYIPYVRQLSEDEPSDEDLTKAEHTTSQWLSHINRPQLVRTLHLTYRYNLEKAMKMDKPSERYWQVAHRKNAEALLGLPHFLVGQSMAAQTVIQKCLSYLAINQRKPLVLAFAGPRGHGKTEMAKRLASLMRSELEILSCFSISGETELFGSQKSHTSGEQGSRLNDFLARNHGQRSIVLLSSFERSTKDVQQVLSLLFDNGEYIDRRNMNKIDCSSTIFILTTNALNSTIQMFCQKNWDVLYNNEDRTAQVRLWKELSKQVKEDFISKFDVLIASYVSAFIPFLPFTLGEQAVLVHKHLLELASEVRAPVNLSSGSDERLVGNVRLRIQRDAIVCRTIAEERYHWEAGVNSIIAGLEPIKALLVDAYLKVDEEIAEAADLIDCVVDVDQGEIVLHMTEPDSPHK